MTSVEYNGNVMPSSNEVVDYDLPNGKIQVRMVTNPVGLPSGTYQIINVTYQNQTPNNIYQLCFNTSNDLWVRNNTSVNTWTAFKQYVTSGSIPITAPDRAILFNNAGTITGVSTLLYTNTGDVSVNGSLRAINATSSLIIGNPALQPSGTPSVSIRTLTGNGGTIFPINGAAAKLQYQSYISTSGNTDLLIFTLPTNSAAYFDVNLITTAPSSNNKLFCVAFTFYAKSDSVVGLTLGPITINYTVAEITGVSYVVANSGGSVAIRSSISPAINTEWNCNATIYPSGVWL